MKEFVIEGYEQFTEKIQELEKTVNKDDKIVILFSGSRNNEGVSWCPDCVKGKLKYLFILINITVKKKRCNLFIITSFKVSMLLFLASISD